MVMVPMAISSMNEAIAPLGWFTAKKMLGAAIAIEHAANNRRPLRRFALMRSPSQPPTRRPMAPTAPTEMADTLLASRRLISWKRYRNGVWKALMAYMLKL